MVNYYYLMEKPFSEWLVNELTKRGMTQSDLAAASGTTPAQISRIISGSRGVGEKTLSMIAKGLDLPPELVFRAAGFLPQQKEVNELVEQLVNQASVLEDEDIYELIEIAKVIRERREKYGVKNARKPSPRTSPSQT